MTRQESGKQKRLITNQIKRFEAIAYNLIENDATGNDPMVTKYLNRADALLVAWHRLP